MTRLTFGRRLPGANIFSTVTPQGANCCILPELKSHAPLVLTISDSHATRRTVSLARAINKELYIVVRTGRLTEIIEIERLVADEVVPDILETGIEIFARLMREFGMEQ